MPSWSALWLMWGLSYFSYCIGCTLRSGLYEIPTMIKSFPCGLENNHACKWISDNFPGITHMSEHLENSYKSICLHGCTPIHEERSFFFLKVWDRFDTLKDLLPWIGEQKYIQMDFWQFSRNADICVIPGKLSEIHLHAWVFYNPREKVLIIVGISCCPIWECNISSTVYRAVHSSI